jgi:hypothetical protein
MLVLQRFTRARRGHFFESGTWLEDRPARCCPAINKDHPQHRPSPAFASRIAARQERRWFGLHRRWREDDGGGQYSRLPGELDFWTCPWSLQWLNRQPGELETHQLAELLRPAPGQFDLPAVLQNYNKTRLPRLLHPAHLHQIEDVLAIRPEKEPRVQTIVEALEAPMDEGPFLLEGDACVIAFGLEENDLLQPHP